MTISDTSFDNGPARGDSHVGLAEQARQVADDLKQTASTVADSVTSAAHQEADEIGNAAKQILDDSTEKMKSAVSEQKNAGAEYLEKVAHAIHRAAGEFEADVPQAARYIRRAGSELSTVAKTVRQRDVRELITEVEDAARRQPALFFGGAVVLGFAALRFLKSSPPTSGQVTADKISPLGQS
jgi:coenzyme F420-reducing hydrogenase alpha subunit